LTRISELLTATIPHPETGDGWGGR